MDRFNVCTNYDRSIVHIIRLNSMTFEFSLRQGLQQQPSTGGEALRLVQRRTSSALPWMAVVPSRSDVFCMSKKLVVQALTRMSISERTRMSVVFGNSEFAIRKLTHWLVHGRTSQCSGTGGGGYPSPRLRHAERLFWRRAGKTA